MIRHLYLAAVIYGLPLGVAFFVGVGLTHLITPTTRTRKGGTR